MSRRTMDSEVFHDIRTTLIKIWPIVGKYCHSFDTRAAISSYKTLENEGTLGWQIIETIRERGYWEYFINKLSLPTVIYLKDHKKI